MRGKEDLFHLIHAMSKSEKRYFVIDAQKSGRKASRYLRLFNAINEMETYDEAALRKKFPKNLSTDKAYLYESILRSMRDYMSATSRAVRIKERLIDARYLFERGLYDQSDQRIREAKALAATLEDQFTLLEINKEEYASLFDRKVQVELEHLEQLNRERNLLSSSIAEELTYLDLYYRLMLEALKDFNYKDRTVLEQLHQRLPLHLLDPTNRPKSAQALRRYYLCNAVYYHLAGDLEKVYAYFLKAVEWWDEHPNLKAEEFHRYIINVSNLVNVMYKTRHAPRAKEWLDKLKAEKRSRSHHNERIIFQKLSIGNLLYLLNTHQFQLAWEALPEIMRQMNKFGLRRNIVLCGNIATVCFLVGEWDRCLEWTEHIMRNIRSASRQDIQRIVRIYKLIAHFEKGDIDSLDAALRATLRYFKTTGLKADDFEMVLLQQYLKPLFNAPLNELAARFRALNAFLVEIAANKYPSLPLGVEELSLWIQNFHAASKGQVIKPDLLSRT